MQSDLNLIAPAPVTNEVVPKKTQKSFWVLPPLPSQVAKLWRWAWPPILLTAVLTLVLFIIFQSSQNYSFKPGLEDKAPLLNGFYGSEKNSNFTYRWSYPEWKINLPLVGRRDYEVRLSALSLKPNPIQVKNIQGEVLATFVPTGQLQTFRFTVPASATPGGDLRLIFQTAGFQPEAGRDSRMLGFLVEGLEIESQSGLVIPPLRAGLVIVASGLAGFWLYLGLATVVRGWRRRVWLPLALGLTAGLAACGQLAISRLDFVNFFLPLTFYLLIAVGLIYLFLVTPLALELVARRVPRLAALSASAPFIASSKTITLPTDGFKPWLLLPIALLGFGLRVVNLEHLPFFLDEGFHTAGAISARTGQLNADGLFALATEGRALQGWVLAGIYNLVGIEQLLFWGRLLSAVCGVVTLLVCYKLAERLFSPRAGLIAAGLWAVTPFALWHERIALVDPLMVACLMLGVYFSVRMLEAAPNLSALLYGLFSGLALTAAILTKLSAGLLLVAPALALLILYRPGQWLKLGPRLGVVYATIWLSAIPTFSLFNRWNESHQVGGFDFGTILHNLGDSVQWSLAYLTLPLLGLVLAGAVGAFFYQGRAALFLTGLVLIPTCFFIVTGNHFWFPRYLLPGLPPLLILTAGGVDFGLSKLAFRGRLRLGLAALALLTLPALWFDYQTVSCAEEAPLPAIDRVQYIEGWASGNGLNQVGRYITAEQGRTNRPVTVFGTDLTPFEGLSQYFSGRPAFRVIYAQQKPFQMRSQIRLAFKNGPVFLAAIEPKDTHIVQRYRETYPAIDFDPILTPVRPGNLARLVLYRMTSKPPGGSPSPDNL